MKEHSRPEIAINPQINFHDVASLALTPVLEYKDGLRTFYSREIVLTDCDGRSHRIHLFADTAERLTTEEEQPK